MHEVRECNDRISRRYTIKLLLTYTVICGIIGLLRVITINNLSEEIKMSDNTQESAVISDNQADSIPEIDMSSMIKQLEAEKQAMVGKLNELLSETKKAKQKAREESESKERLAIEKAKKDGDFEQLLKSSERERQELANKLNELSSRVSSEKLRTESLKISTELADGANAELLSEFVSKRLKYTDEGIKVLDSNGDLTVSSIDDLKREFASSDKFKSLLRGNKAKGGNAQGSGNSVDAKTKTVDRETFDNMTQIQRVEHFKNGGKVSN